MLRLLFLFLTLAPIGLQASEVDSTMVMDSAVVKCDTIKLSKLKVKADNIGSSRLFQATYLGVPLIAGGLLEKQFDNKFRRLRNDFMPSFHRSLDNYLQLAPAVVMVGLKAAGVPSRSSWGRMIASDAISTVLMAGVVQGLKTTTHVMRPDGSNNHSFPSGHTATAFMAATMLSKEYGHLSPWVSVGAYSVATATGLMRVANNKHWLSDVMVGAGVGILSTEFGYWIADAIRKDKGLNIKEVQQEIAYSYDRPSFFGLYLGFNVPLSRYDVNESIDFQTSMGTTLGVEGAYFLNRYIGLGGRATMSNLQFIVNGTEAPENTLNFYNFSLGPYFSVPVTPRWTLGTKLLATYTQYNATTIGGLRVPRNGGMGVGSGINIDYRVRQHFGFGLFMDYNIQPPHSQHSGEYVHTMTLGAKAAIRF
jgi:membrane-associated phospholipid phosphatase